MSPVILLILLVLATYRLSELVTKDEIFEGFRQAIGKKAATGSRIWKFVAKLVRCPLCLGIYFSVASALVYLAIFAEVRTVLYFFVTWLGIAGAQYFLSLVFLNREDN